MGLNNVTPDERNIIAAIGAWGGLEGSDVALPQITAATGLSDEVARNTIESMGEQGMIAWLPVPSAQAVLMAHLLPLGRYIALGGK